MADKEEFDGDDTTEVEAFQPLPPSPSPHVLGMGTEELTAEEREKLLARKQEKDAAYHARMVKWGKVALYSMFFPCALSILTIICGVW